MNYFTVFLVFFFSLLSSAQTPSTKTSAPQKIVVHLSRGTSDLRAAIMAFRIGEVMQKKAQVTVFLDQEGGRWADPQQNLNLTWGNSKIEDLIKGFQNAGGQIIVCPVCLDENGTNKKSLRQGFVSGNAESISQMFLDADKVIDF